MRLIPPGARFLVRRGLACKRTALPLSAPQVLIGELMSQTGIGIVGGIPALTLLLRIRWLGQSLLLVLPLILTLLLRLAISRLIRGCHEVSGPGPGPGPGAVASRTLRWGGTKVSGGLGRRIFKRLRERRRSRGVDVPI